MNKFIPAMMLSSAVFLTGCNMQTAEPQMTPLQIQSMQTKTFKTNKRKAFNSTMQVFQDMGYTVKSANYDTGFISAQSMTKDGDANKSKFFKVVKALGEMNSHRSVNSSKLTKATAFVAPTADKQVKIRVSLVDVSNTSVNGGAPNERDTQILNANAYDKIFNRIRQGLFVG